MSVYDSEHELPNGLKFATRPGTSDYNTVRACGYEDEYETEALDVEDKLVFDFGAHIGGWGIRQLQRGARVVFVEAVPENAEMILNNLSLNGFMPCGGPQASLRWTVINAAVGDPPELRVTYGWHGDENADIHTFIGNTGLGHAGYDGVKEVMVSTVQLSKLVAEHGKPAIIKTDCEGGEWQVFQDPARVDIPLIVGEWHDLGKGYTNEDGVWIETQSCWHIDDVIRFLEPTHELTFSGPREGAGGFRAVLR